LSLGSWLAREGGSNVLPRLSTPAAEANSTRSQRCLGRLLPPGGSPACSLRGSRQARRGAAGMLAMAEGPGGRSWGQPAALMVPWSPGRCCSYPQHIPRAMGVRS